MFLLAVYFACERRKERRKNERRGDSRQIQLLLFKLLNVFRFSSVIFVTILLSFSLVFIPEEEPVDVQC